MDAAALFVVQPGTAVRGQEEIKAALSAMMAARPKLTTLTAHLFPCGDTALYHSEWEMLFVDENGREVREHGFSADVLRRQANGQWKILIDNPWGTAVLGNR